jgi:hypothetical protein
VVHGLEILRRLNDQASASSDLSACLGAEAHLADAVPPRLGDGLLPCPLCGEIVTLEDEWTEWYDQIEETERQHKYETIQCKVCSLILTNYERDIDVRKTWNRRAGGSRTF